MTQVTTRIKTEATNLERAAQAIDYAEIARNMYPASHFETDATQIAHLINGTSIGYSSLSYSNESRNTSVVTHSDDISSSQSNSPSSTSYYTSGEALKPNISYTLGSPGYSMSQSDTGSLSLSLPGGKDLEFSKSEATAALSFIEVAQKVQIPLEICGGLKQILPTLLRIPEFSGLKNGMSQIEELALLKKLTQVFGLESISLDETDPGALMRSIAIHTAQPGKSFAEYGRQNGIFRSDGVLRVEEFTRRLREPRLG